ncbi:MAG: methenyltetrahydromethanopterin cyclohydrolase [Thiotrichales bacterium]|nr:methenyltetrahydromethanopterin cyclohydrolase [Thiotrichales bacterium]
MTKSQVSVNSLSVPLVRQLLDQAHTLRLKTHTLDNGCTVIDAGIDATGGLEAGRLIGEICLGGLGQVRLRASTNFQNWSWHVDVHSCNPVIACLASQYAGWSLSHGEGKAAFNALGSGPGRALGSKEELFDELGYRDSAASAVLVIEADSIPPLAIADKVSTACGINARDLTLIITPTSSLAGGVQVVSRVLETALHKVHALGYALDNIVDGAGSAPVPPPAKDFLTAMSRTNDAILFAGQVQLYVNEVDDVAAEMAKKLPSSASNDYGRPFGEVFKSVNYDFYQIDPMLFSPARVTITSLETGNSFQAGAIDLALLDQSFSGACG